MAKRQTGISRRDLIKASAIVAAGAVAGVPALATKRQRPSPNDRIRFAAVGIGGRGAANVDSAAAHGDIVALCDIDAQARSKSLLQFPNASTFADFRKMLEGLADDIDAVIVSTPDHTHAPAAALAMKLGMHVYCEKPLTRTVFEARRLAQLAREKKVATQMGNQGTAGADLRKVAALVKAGTFGRPKEVHCWTDRSGGWWPQGVRRPDPQPSPPHISWDLWLGPSPERPYAPGYHPFAWRGWWDFGSGALGDIGCHCMNLPYMALDLRDPAAITAETSPHNADSFPAWSIVHYDFPARGSRPAVQLHWYDGGKKPNEQLAGGMSLAPNGCLMVFDDATIYSPGEYGSGGQLVGGGALPHVDFEPSPGHFAEFVEAIRGGRPAKSDIAGYSAGLTEVVVLGNLAVWARGERLEWDSRRMAVRRREDLNALIRPSYRSGWPL